MNQNFVENYVNGLLNLPFAEVKKALKKIGFEWVCNETETYKDEGIRVRQSEFWYGNREYSAILVFKVGGKRELVDFFDFVDWEEFNNFFEELKEKA